MPIEFVHSDLGDVVVVGIVGELDLATAPSARQELLARSLEQSDRPRLVIDLLGVDHLDAIGIGVLLAGVVATRTRGGDLALCRAEPHVGAVLRLTRVDEILPILPSVDAAVDALRAPTAPTAVPDR